MGEATKTYPFPRLLPALRLLKKIGENTLSEYFLTFAIQYGALDQPLIYFDNLIAIILNRPLRIQLLNKSLNKSRSLTIVNTSLHSPAEFSNFSIRGNNFLQLRFLSPRTASW